MESVFDHEHLRVYQRAIGFVAWLEHPFANVRNPIPAYSHLVRASASIPVNIAEASGKLSLRERRQFIIKDGNRIWFDHEKLDVYQKALDVIRWIDQLSKTGHVSGSVKTSLDKASTGIALNVAEGNGKFSIKDRCRFINHARTAALQAAATLDILAARHTGAKNDTMEGKALLADIVRMLVAWQRALTAA